MGKIKIQSNSLNRIQQQGNARQSAEYSSRNQAVGSLLVNTAAGISASGSHLGRPSRPLTNNLVAAGATIMANSPVHTLEDSPAMSMPGS